MEWHEADKEYKKINEELVSGLSRLIDDKLIRKIVDIKGRTDYTTIQNQRDQISDLQSLVEEIGKTLGIKFGYAGQYDKAISRKKYEESVIKLIREKLSTGVKIKKEPELVITIGGEYSSTFKVDEKDYESYKACKSCGEYEEDDEDEEEFMEHVRDSELIMSEYVNRHPDDKVDDITIKQIDAFFEEIVKDDSISLNIFAKMIETLIPIDRMSHNTIAWL
jgi:translation initiation factor 2 beta subunit (eIF-2beta)/eIF-5